MLLSPQQHAGCQSTLTSKSLASAQLTQGSAANSGPREVCLVDSCKSWSHTVMLFHIEILKHTDDKRNLCDNSSTLAGKAHSAGRAPSSAQAGQLQVLN